MSAYGSGSYGSGPYGLTLTVPPTEAATWAAAVTTHDWTVRAFIGSFTGLAITQALNGGLSCVLNVSRGDPALRELAAGARCIVVWENGEVRIRGRIGEPLMITQDGSTVTVPGQFALLARRQRQEPLTFVQATDVEILGTLVAGENARRPTGLRFAGTEHSGQRRDRTYEMGKSIHEAMVQLAEVDDGPYLLELPALTDNAYLSELVTRYPLAGVDRPDLRFEYGDGTLGNIATYSYGGRLPVNGVRTVGGGTGEEARETVRVDDTASQDEHGLYETFVSLNDVTTVETLGQHALGLLAPTPGFTIEFTLADIERLPRLWHDFDIGDSGRLYIRDDGLTLGPLRVRVDIATNTVSDTGERATLSAVGVTVL